MSARPPTQTPKAYSVRNARLAIWSGAVLIVLSAFVAASWLRSQRPPRKSDVVCAPWSKLRGGIWLLPDLKNARVIVPDRPHSIPEAMALRDGRGEPIKRVREFRVSTNEHRLRGPPLKERQPGVFRILAIGNSITLGYGVENAETYPAQLERMLTARGYNVEVLNAGMAGQPNNDLFCNLIAPDLRPDVVIWTNRPSRPDVRGASIEESDVHGFVESVLDCRNVTGAEMVVVLTPISTFDLGRRTIWEEEEDLVRKGLSPHNIPVLELTHAFRQAQTGKGDVLTIEDGSLIIWDQKRQRERLRVVDPGGETIDFPAEVHSLFEENAEVREALLFDGGHPDAEGFVVFATAVADTLEPVLKSIRHQRVPGDSKAAPKVSL